MLEERARQQDTVVDVHQFPTTTLAMTVRDLVVRPDASAAGFTITLPPVSEAKGMFFSIIVQDADNTHLVTITDNNDSEVWDTDFTLNEKGRGVIFYSDGMKWHYGSKHFTSSLDAGAVNLDEVHLIMDTAGLATVSAFIVRLESDVMLGNTASAIFAQIDYDDGAAGVGGLSATVCAEMKLPNHAAIPSGYYTCVDHEMATGALTNWGGSTKVSYMRFDDWGDNEAEFAASAFFFTLGGVRLAGNMISLNTHTIKMQFETDAFKTRYLVCSEVEDVIVMGNALTYETISSIYQVGIYGMIANNNANLADGWFVQNWHQFNIEDGTDFTGTAQVFGLYAYLNYAGASSWGGSGSLSAGIAQMVSGASAVVVTDGIHSCFATNLTLGAGYDLSAPADLCGIFIAGTLNIGVTVADDRSSALFIAKMGVKEWGAGIKLSAGSTPNLLNLYVDTTMVTATAAAAGNTVLTKKIRILIDGTVYYLLATTTPA